jgi:hypothetical protein
MFRTPRLIDCRRVARQNGCNLAGYLSDRDQDHSVQYLKNDVEANLVGSDYGLESVSAWELSINNPPTKPAAVIDTTAGCKKPGRTIFHGLFEQTEVCCCTAGAAFRQVGLHFYVHLESCRCGGGVVAPQFLRRWRTGSQPNQPATRWPKAVHEENFRREVVIPKYTSATTR